MLHLKQSTASQSVLIGPFVDDTDGATAETGLTIANTDIRLSKNGGNLAAKNSGGGTHDEAGWYQITLDATDTDTVGRLQLHVKVAGALMVHAEFQVLEEAIYDALYGASAAGFDTNGEVTVGGYNSSLDFNATQKASINTEADTALTDYDPPTKAELDTAVADVSVDEIQATALADLFNTDSGTTYASAVAGSPVKEIADNAGGSALTESGIADAVLDELLSGHTDAGSLGKAIADIESDATAILADTNELQTDDIPGTLTTIEGKIDTIDSNVDAVLVDTGTTIPGTITTVDTVVDAIKAVTDNLPNSGALTTIANNISAILTDTGTTLDTKINTIDTIVDAIKAKTDSLTFTQSGHVDSNVQRINDVAITGDGSTTPFNV